MNLGIKLAFQPRREKYAQFCKLRNQAEAMIKAHNGCPVQATSNVMSGKWKVQILWHLSIRSYRFSEVRDRLPGVSEKVLTAQLRELEIDGLIVRESAHTVPPRVDYRLSPAGQQLVPILETMCVWATAHLGIQPTLPPRRELLAKAG